MRILLDTNRYRDFARGGLLELWLGPQPNRAWGKSPVALAAD